ncbi:DUF5693 family protein [Paenibacillus pasadenensis]|uniref:Uncharacterized protein n=1 Tax=Paenibacillus pasadenensis TaxID=217090 RepID=A0A2N5NDI7_9BACL|nr:MULTISPECIES: DUF5693 family protein [Paenibacillus]PLT48404.1 hypothetical protein B8V81_0536 [Paenibacillus pasadenensis]QGG58121.1 hypothetical protein GE073_22780 [Paenibacillus sp. B01]
MLKWQQWNRGARKVLWVLALACVALSMPIGASRWQMEKTADTVEYVFDYSDLVLVASYQAKPEEFMSAELEKLKAAGVGTMSVFESRLDELEMAGRLGLYSEAEAALLQNKPVPADRNFTYLLFEGETEQAALEPIIRARFESSGIRVDSWSFDGLAGLVLETPLSDAVLKTMEPDPLALDRLTQAGFHLLPRLSDRIPYDQQQADGMLARFKELGVTRILFDGNAVKGAAEQANLRSLDGFAELLNKYGIGLSAIENLKKPQEGLNTLAYKTHYNVARLYSLSDKDAAALKPDVIVDRFLLAAKDRNIRMFYLNAAPSANLDKGMVTNPLDNLYASIGGKDGAVQTLDRSGFPSGQATAFERDQPSWHKALKGASALGAVSLIALLAGAFFGGLTIPVFLLGLVGSAGLYVLNSSLMEQGLALGAAIAAPTLAMVWVINRIYAHTDGPRRPVGGEWSSSGSEATFQVSPWSAMLGGLSQPGTRWVFHGLSAGRRLSMALAMFVVATLISLLAVPIVVGLLNNITYSLVLQQFRGVNLLALAPMALTAAYLFLFTGGSFWTSLRRLLSLQITILWIAAAAVLGIVGLYYLSRTGNGGTAPGFELVFRNLLESTFGVRPRTKEFLLAHPLMLLGLFLALRYRAAWVLLVVGAMGQLSMVGTFTHIHTPLPMSLIRVLLGLGLGAIIGLALIAAWQIGEALYRKLRSRGKEATLHG